MRADLRRGDVSPQTDKVLMITYVANVYREAERLEDNAFISSYRQCRQLGSCAIGEERPSAQTQPERQTVSLQPVSQTQNMIT